MRTDAGDNNACQGHLNCLSVKADPFVDYVHPVREGMFGMRMAPAGVGGNVPFITAGCQVMVKISGFFNFGKTGTEIAEKRQRETVCADI